MAEFNSGRNESARSNYGGIQAVYLINFQTLGYDPIDLSTGTLSKIGLTTTIPVIGYKFELRGQNTFSQPGAGGGSETGTNVVVQNLVLQLKTTGAADNVNIQNIATNRPHVIVVDYKGGIWLAGRENGLEVKKYEQVFGTNPEDFVGYNLEFEGKERAFANYAGQLEADGTLPNALLVTELIPTDIPG